MELSNQNECVLIKNEIQQLINLHTMLPLGLAWNETCKVGLLVRVVVVLVVVNTADLQATPFIVNVILRGMSEI